MPKLVSAKSKRGTLYFDVDLRKHNEARTYGDRGMLSCDSGVLCPSLAWERTADPRRAAENAKDGNALALLDGTAPCTLVLTDVQVLPKEKQKSDGWLTLFIGDQPQWKLPWGHAVLGDRHLLFRFYDAGTVIVPTRQHFYFQVTEPNRHDIYTLAVGYVTDEDTL